MKRLFTSVILTIVFCGSQAHAQIPDPKFLNDAPGERHWFASPGSGSDVNPTSLPIKVHFDNTSLGNLSNGDAVQAVKDAFAQWNAVACTSLPVDTTETPDPSNHIGFNPSDNRTTISFDYVAAAFPPGVLAATTTPASASDTEIRNGHTWHRIKDFDLVFGTGITWTTRANEPGCSGAIDVQSVAVHEIGHGLGYAHTCEQGESCGNPLLRDSIMYWAVDSCHALLANAYDNKQHSVSYGLGSAADFSSDKVGGALPLTVAFTPGVLSSASIQSATWTFGDGDSSAATAPSHSYQAEGRYTVDAKLTFAPTAPVCGTVPFTNDVRKLNYITACNTLVPKFHFSVSGKTVHFFNDTDGAATGCLSTLAWDFGDGSTGFVREPIHTYAQGGKYTVTLTPSGPAGQPAPASMDVSTGGGKKGCSVDGIPDGNMAAAIGSLGAALAMCLVTVSRRKSAR